MAVYGYIRVSTAKQVAEDSPDTQRMTIAQLAMDISKMMRYPVKQNRNNVRNSGNW